MVVSLYVDGKSHVSNGQNVSFKEPCLARQGSVLRGPSHVRRFVGLDHRLGVPIEQAHNYSQVLLLASLFVTMIKVTP